MSAQGVSPSSSPDEKRFLLLRNPQTKAPRESLVGAGRNEDQTQERGVGAYEDGQQVRIPTCTKTNREAGSKNNVCELVSWKEDCRGVCLGLGGSGGSGNMVHRWHRRYRG